MNNITYIPFSGQWVSPSSFSQLYNIVYVRRSGLPHVNEQDDIFNGYYIPKGSVIMPCIWGFSKDPAMHDKPFEFIPERFIGGDAYGGRPAETDVMTYAFGFGRRYGFASM